MRSAMTLFLFVYFSAGLDFTASAQIGDDLQGIVGVGRTLAPPALVRVRLRTLEGASHEMLVREGRFTFRGVAPRRYTLIVDAPGYETLERIVDTTFEHFVVLELRPDRKAKVQTENEVVSVSALNIPKSALREFAAAKTKITENDCGEAIVHLKKAIGEYEQFADAHISMAKCYALLERFDDAEREFKLALEQPHLAALHLELAKIYDRQKNTALLKRQL